jgi:hypothetical protein
MGVCTHSSTNVQVARAQTRYHATLHTRATARGSQDATPAPLLGAHRARQRWCGERYRQTPGDHATNLGATMLDYATRGSAGLSSSEEPGALRPLRALRFSLLRRSLWVSSLYILHAPQLPHAWQPTRAPHIYVSSPSPCCFRATPM